MLIFVACDGAPVCEIKAERGAQQHCARGLRGGLIHKGPRECIGFFFADTGIEVIFRQRSGSLWAGQVGGNFPIVWLAPGGGNLSCVPLAMKGLPET